MKIMTMAVRNSHWNFLKSIAVSTQAEESILMKTASYSSLTAGERHVADDLVRSVQAQVDRLDDALLDH